jgi:kynurenine formamidase
MTGSGEAYAKHPDAPAGPMQGSGDFIGMAFHGYSITHLDSLCHIFWNGQMYNGRSSALVTTREGATAQAIDVLQDGVVSRGVLLDAARHRGVSWMEPGEAIMPDELEEIEAEQGVKVQQGDILLVRTGHYRRRLEVGPRPIADGWPGLHASCMPWLQERQVALLGGDTVSDTVPSGYSNLPQPIHQIAIPQMGLWLLDNCNLEELSAACAERLRWEFLLTIAPLRIRYGTGSPVNPIAVF